MYVFTCGHDWPESEHQRKTLHELNQEVEAACSCCFEVGIALRQVRLHLGHGGHVSADPLIHGDQVPMDKI